MALIIGRDAADQGESDLRAWRAARSGHCRHLEAGNESYRFHLREGLPLNTRSSGAQQQQSPRGSPDVLDAVMG